MADIVDAIVQTNTDVNDIPKITRGISGQPVLGPSKLTDDGTTLRYNGSPVGGGSISGLTPGVLPLAATSSSLADSPIDYGVTNASQVTISPKTNVGPPESDLPVLLQGYTEPQILITATDHLSAIGTEAVFTDQNSAAAHYLAGVSKDVAINNGDLVGFEADLYTSVDSTNDHSQLTGAYLYLEHDAPGTLNAANGIVIESVSKGGGAGVIASVIGLLINDQNVGATNRAIKTGVGIVELGDVLIYKGVIRTSQTFTVATLPSAATSGAGARAFVTDATVATFASAVVGGGTNKVPVYSDGSVWKIG